MTPWLLGTPTLARSEVDRSEELREPARLRDNWQDARLLVVDEQLRMPIRLTSGSPFLALQPAAARHSLPPVGAVMVGRADRCDHWAMCGDGDVALGVSADTASPTAAGARDGDVEWRSFRSVAADLGDRDAAIGATALALLTWQRRTQFCTRCGRAMAPALGGHSRSCSVGHQEFPRTDPAVIVLVHDGADRIVLAQNVAWPTGRFSVLAGFVEAGESLEASVAREIKEEIGVEVDAIEYLGSQPWPFPRSLMVAFAARADPGAVLWPARGEIAAARWFARAELHALLGSHHGGSEQPNAGITLPGELSIARRMIEAFAHGDT